MPKGLQNINPEILERLRHKVAQSLAFSLNTNKSYDLLSNIIFKRTGALLSNSTLRRVFQYSSNNHPTKSTLDLICISIGFHDWDDFINKEINHSQVDLSQLITIFKLQGLGNQGQTWQTLEKFSSHPNFFGLLDTVVQIAISNRDIEFLRKIFDIKGVFEKDDHPVPIIYFIHKLVICLNQSGLMPELIPTYGASKNAQAQLIESYVDEDNLTGYFYDLMQVYHKHKTSQEARLFYHCLMYQRAIENSLPTSPHLEFIRQFNDSIAVHNLPKGRRLAILMLEANDSDETIREILNKAQDLFHDLNEIARITTALYMVKLLFVKRKNELMGKILLLAPEVNDADWNIDDLTNINQIKIYRAYSLYKSGNRENAQRKLKEFDPLLVHAFIYDHIMNDFRIIRDLLANE
jgi:hypothetical protein